MAMRLRDAADAETRRALPDLVSLQRYVRNYEAGRNHPGDLYAELYARAFGLSHAALFETSPAGDAETGGLPTEHDAASLTTWVGTTNISDAGLDQLALATAGLAEAHTRRPPTEVLSDVMRLHQQVQALLRGGRQRLKQTRELIRLDADLLAHACLLLGDLHYQQAATAWGAAATTYATEADASAALALSAEAKTARWQGRAADAVDLAARGYACSPPTPIRTILACYEANAAGLMGDIRRANDALRRAERAADEVEDDSGTSVWSCPRPRRALFALAVATRSGDAKAALSAAQLADDGWAAGDPWSQGTWAQIRVGSGIAHVMSGDLDGVAEQIAPMLELASEYRMATVTDYLKDLDRRLAQRRFSSSPITTTLREQIREFNAGALKAAPI